MWVLYARPPTPNAPYWPGRRWLALIDALLWPSLVAVGVSRMPMDPGLVGQVAYFSPSWTAFQADRGRRFSGIVDDRGGAQVIF